MDASRIAVLRALGTQGARSAARPASIRGPEGFLQTTYGPCVFTLLTLRRSEGISTAPSTQRCSVQTAMNARTALMQLSRRTALLSRASLPSAGFGLCQESNVSCLTRPATTVMPVRKAAPSVATPQAESKGADGPGYAVPIHPHLIGIGPTRRHSRLHRLAAYTRCLRCAHSHVTRGLPH